MKARGLPIICLAVALALPLLPKAANAEQDCEWLAGDLHVHTTYSHDSYGGPGDDNTGPEEFYTLGHPVASQFALASARGLDFTAISDHNDIRSQSDPGFATMGVIGLPAYENSLDGHAQMLGARKVYDKSDRSAAGIQALADALRADGGAFQINHPGQGDWALGTAVVPDTVEVWNISRLYQPPFPSGSDNDDAIALWQSFLDAGDHVAATGGSDNHFLATSGVQGVGQPTTWVCASVPSVAGIIDGLLADRTYISHQPPAHGAPGLFLEADVDGDGSFTATIGDTVPEESTLRVRVTGAPGSLLRLVGDGGAFIADPIPVTSGDFEHTFTAPLGSTWIRAEIFEPDAAEERSATCNDQLGSQTTYCRNDVAVLALTSAIFLGADDEAIATGLEWVGDTQARGTEVELAARLTDDEGAPLAGRDVTFTANGQAYPAVTDPSGTARTTVRFTGHGRSQEARADFYGTERYLPSSVQVTITWGI